MIKDTYLSERQSCMILNALPNVGPIRFQKLFEIFGSATGILNAALKTLKEVEGMGAQVAKIIATWGDYFDLKQEEAALEAHDARFITGENYSRLLREIQDPPIGLYSLGNVVQERKGCIAIVGSRRATLYGLRVAKQLAGELARAGFCIVSGLARGIDSAAHKGALEVGGKTISVLGCGVDIVYPPENLTLYREVINQGTVLSEFPLGRRADKGTFPRRNRIISGLSKAVIVVESAVNGGSMITANFAAEQNRIVFAVPGQIDQEMSKGCHRLIREGAILCQTVEDVLEELNFSGYLTALTSEEKKK